VSELGDAILNLRTVALGRILSLRGITASQAEIRLLAPYRTDAEIIEELKARRDKSSWLRLWFRS
jgi:hypothetical protein